MKKHSGVWQYLSSNWILSGHPLHPSVDDRSVLEKVLQKWIAHNNTIPKALILGVTPQMACLDWPDGTDLLAVDYSQQMIDRVWPGYPEPGEGALCANWLNLPIDGSSRDLIFGDGPFGVLPYPHIYKKLLHSVRRVLKPKGIFAFRIFIRPDETENPELIFKEALAGKIDNFHAFKLRLLMSMQPDSETGVCIGDVWNYWADQEIDPQLLARKTGWPHDHIETMKGYRNQRDVYHFPTLQEIRNLMAEGNFKELNCYWPAYELGERCPTFAYSPEISIE